MKTRIYTCTKCGAVKASLADFCTNPHCEWGKDHAPKTADAKLNPQQRAEAELLMGNLLADEDALRKFVYQAIALRDSTPPYVHAPAGWKLAPLEPTPEMLAAAAVAVLPRAAPADVALAKKAAPLVMMDGASGDESFEIVTATMATMPPFYRAMLAAAPDAPALISKSD